MTPFLKQVAEHWFALPDISSRCFVFPNRRAMVFFGKYLKEAVQRSGKPVFAPRMLTMSDFFYAISKSRPTDRVHLLLKLYDCYKSLNPQAEPLDDFIFWGDVLLSDFDDADKYLADPRLLFTNVSDFKSMQGDLSFLSENQVKALEQFLGHFEKHGEYKDRFRRIWDILYPLYVSFNEVLDKEGLSYEGKVYRQTADRLQSESVVDVLAPSFPGCGSFVFVGLNALSGCERKVLRRMRDAGVAEFCWDYSGPMIKDPSNRSSLFLSEFTVEFPQAFPLEDEDIPTRFRAISVPSSTGQAKLLPELLKELPSPGIETAIVLPDEGLLLPVLNSIPENIRDLNVTMGYPMKGSALWSLMNDIAAMQLHVREKDGRRMFWHRQVWSVFSSSIFRSVADEATLAAMEEIKKKAEYYVPESELGVTPLLKAVFVAVPMDDIPALEDYQLNLITTIAGLLKNVPGMDMELDFAREYVLAVSRLKTHVLPVRGATYFRLVDKLVCGSAMPFKGEPLSGLQIMGPLETRALDFDNVIILGCNEGVFPRRSVSSSFIPPELRKGFDLPTYAYQDAVWAYYFYRLIRRAKNVVMVYDSRTEMSRSGEESRYIKQLEMHFGVDVERYVATAEIKPAPAVGEIVKTDQDVAKLRSINLSASALQNYLSCPAKFYFSKIKGLKAEEDILDAMDAGMIGSALHETLEDLYRPYRVVTRADLSAMRKDKGRIRDIVREKIMKQLKTFEVTGRNIIYEDMICRYVDRVLMRDGQLLEKYGTDSFRVLGVELPVDKVIDGFRVVGVIDRLDSFAPDELRVVDYKTGKVMDEDFIINEGNAAAVVGALFGENDLKRPKIALQLYLYDLFAKDRKDAEGRKIYNSIYQTGRLFQKDVENVELCEEFCSMMQERLSGLLREMSDTSVPWRRNLQSCKYCDFKNICGQ